MANPKLSAPRVARPRPTGVAPRRSVAAMRGASPASGNSPMATRMDEALDETYAHVRRDLRRIIFLAVLLLAGIYGSQYL